MKPEWLIGVSMYGYGVSLSVGVGIPIPVLNEEIVESASVEDKDIVAPIVDYSEAYPQRKPEILGFVSYAELKSGVIRINNKEVPTGSLSSMRKARQIANILKIWIKEGKFTLTEPVANIPSSDSGYVFKSLKERKPQDV